MTHYHFGATASGSGCPLCENDKRFKALADLGQLVVDEREALDIAEFWLNERGLISYRDSLRSILAAADSLSRDADARPDP